MLNILHISDLHFGIVPDEEHTTTSVQRREYVLSKLIEKIDEISETDNKPDIIVISGDIGWRAKSSDYDLASAWINKLLVACSLSWDDVILCPGNHDIDRSKLTDDCFIKNKKDANEKLRVENICERSGHFSEFVNFCKKNNVKPYINSAVSPEDEIKYLYGFRKIKGVTFISWNSAWNCKGNDLGNLYIGEPLTLDMQCILPENKMSVSVLHHPFNWLNEEEQFAYRNDPISVDSILKLSSIVLNGHVHGKIREATFYHNKSYIFTSGATYEKEHYQLGSQIITLDLNNNAYSTKVISYNTIECEWNVSQLEQGVSLSSNNITTNKKSDSLSCKIKTKDITIGTKNPVSHMVGREVDVKNILEIFENNRRENNKTHLWIYGMGGLGKTQLCRKLYYIFDSKIPFIGWVSCQGDFRTSLVNSMLNRNSTDNLDEAFNKSVEYINKLGKRLILFVDNFDGFDQSIKDIESLKCNVIVTSRNKNPDTFKEYELGFLPFEQCKQLFREFYKLEENVYMNEIIHKTGYLTLAIELVAKTGRKMGITLEKLYCKLDEKGFDIQTVVKSNWDNNGEQLNAEMAKQFSIVFDLSSLKYNKDALYILSNFALLPYLTINQGKIISWLALDEENNLLFDLYESGWLQCFEFDYAMHPVISYSILKNNPPSFNDSKTLILSLAEQIKVNATDNFLESLIYLPFADSVGEFFKKIELTTESANDVALLCIRIAEVYRHNGEYSKSLEWAGFSEKSWAHSSKENGVLANLIYNTLSEIHLDMRNSNEECEKWALCAINEDKKHKNLDKFLRSASYHNLACAYIQMGKYEKALEKQLMVVSLREKNSGSSNDKIRLGNAYRNLAMVYRRLKNVDAAFSYQKKVIDILEDVYFENENHPDFPVAYSLYSFILRDRGDIGEAIKYQNKALKIRETVNDKDPKLAINYNNLGMFNLRAGNLQDAKKCMEKAIELNLQNRDEKHPDLASDYFNYAKVLYALNDVKNAILYLRKSKEIEEINLCFDNVKEVEDLILQYQKHQKI